MAVVARPLPSAAPAPTRIPSEVVVGTALLVGGGIAAMTLPGYRQTPLTSVLLGSTFGLFAFVLRGPVWALAPVLVIEFSIGQLLLPEPGASVRTLTVATATLLSLGVLWRQGLALFRDGAGQRVVVPMLLLIGLATALDLSREQADLVFKYMRYQLVQLVAILLAASLVRRREDLKWALAIALTIAVASALVAVAQKEDHLNYRLYAGVSRANVLFFGRRVLGLTGSPIQLSDSMVMAVLPMAAVLLAKGVRSARAWWGLALATGLALLATYYTLTRSAVLAIALGLAAITLFLPWSRRALVWGSLAAAVMLFFALEGSGLINSRFYATTSDNNSTATHAALLDVGLAIAIDHPIVGIGHGQFQEASVGYVGAVAADASTRGGGELGTVPPHNDFLLVAVSWGVPALLAYVGIVMGAVINALFAIAHHRDGLVRATALGVFGALIAYTVNSSFHNILDSSLFLPLLAGLSIALVRLPARAERRPRRLMRWRPAPAR